MPFEVATDYDVCRNKCDNGEHKHCEEVTSFNNDSVILSWQADFANMVYIFAKCAEMIIHGNFVMHIQYVLSRMC